jgi:hypothetical protein
VGFDIGPDQISEDLVFEARTRAQFGPIFHLLKGFAYEQAPLGLRDQLRQRRRWVQGWLRAFRTMKLGATRRAMMAYHLVVWASAIVSLVAVAASVRYGFSPFFAYSGVVAGIAWTSLVLGPYNGYVLNRPYLPTPTIPIWRILANGICGLLVDTVALWYAFLTPGPARFEVIAKDLPRHRACDRETFQGNGRSRGTKVDRRGVRHSGISHGSR